MGLLVCFDFPPMLIYIYLGYLDTNFLGKIPQIYLDFSMRYLGETNYSP